MKILCVIDSLTSGGSQRQIVTLAYGLLNLGHQIEFFIYYPQFDFFYPELKKGKIPIHTYNKKFKYSLGIIPVLHKLIIKESFDCILSFLDTPNFYSEIAHIFCKDIPLVISERSVNLSDTITLTNRFKQQFHRLADHITVNSNYQRKKMEKFFPWMCGRISTIYNGIDLKAFKFIQRTKKNTQLKLLAVGTVIPNKNYLTLIKAIDIIREKYGYICQVQWAGKQNNDKESSDAFQEANSLIVKLGLEYNWQWLGECRDIPGLLSQCDALIHPSYYEGLPNSICEALACGRPVLASNVCDHPILIKEGWNGFLFDPYSPDSIVDAIIRIIKMHQANYDEMASNARKYAEDHLSVEHYAKAYETLFFSLINR